MILAVIFFLPSGFNDLVHVAAAISAMSQGYTEVDGLKTSKKYVAEGYKIRIMRWGLFFFFLLPSLSSSIQYLLRYVY